MRDEPDDFHLAQQASQLAWNTATSLRAGDLAGARRDCEQALELSERAGHRHGAASVRTTLGRILLAQGDLVAARACLNEALSVHREQEQGRLVGLTQLELAGCDLEAGLLAPALSKLIDAATAFARSAEPTFEAATNLRIAAVHHGAGRLDEARRHAEVALGVGRSAHDDGLQAACLGRLAALSHERGRRTSARRLLGQAQAIAHGLGDARGELGCRLGLARIGLEQGEDVLDEANAVFDAFEALDDRWALGAAASLLGAVHGARGDRLAYSMLAKADHCLHDHPLRRHLPPIDQGWLDLARGDRDAALHRFGAVPAEALRSVAVRLALASLRQRLGQTAPAMELS